MDLGSWHFGIEDGICDIASVETPASILKTKKIRLNKFCLVEKMSVTRTEALLHVNLCECTLLVHLRVQERGQLCFRGTPLRRVGEREYVAVVNLHCCTTGGKRSEHVVSGG